MPKRPDTGQGEVNVAKASGRNGSGNLDVDGGRSSRFDPLPVPPDRCHQIRQQSYRSGDNCLDHIEAVIANRWLYNHHPDNVEGHTMSLLAIIIR